MNAKSSPRTPQTQARDLGRRQFGGSAGRPISLVPGRRPTCPAGPERTQRAPAPRSPVRTPTTDSAGMTQTLPSPIFPVAAEDTMASTTVSAWSSSTSTSTRILGTKSTRIRPPVVLGVSPLTTEALGLGDRHALDADVLQDVLHVVEFERLDNRDHEFHASLPQTSRAPLPPGPP